jgi:hypothetical protein
MMKPRQTDFYPPSANQSSRHSQWPYQPSFYNGYAPNYFSTQPVTTYVPAYTTPSYVYYASPPAANPMPLKPVAFLRQAFSSSASQQQSDEEYIFHEQQLQHNLSTHGFQRLPVKGDGNCLFYALAEGLIYEMKNDPDEFGAAIRYALELPPRSVRLSEFADRLRQFCVSQWRLNEDYYCQFVDQEKVSFAKEVKKFSKNGVSESILGDIVPLTVANGLDLHITIFTSVSDLPRIDVKSERKQSPLRKTIYLAYNQFGSGHYDAAYPISPRSG